MANDQALIQRAETQRDLKSQMSESLGAEEESEFQFYEWSPGRTYVTLWSMETGEKIELPRYQAAAALNAVNPDGQYRFTAYEDRAPERIINDTKCIFHKESPYRAFMEEVGVVGRNEVICRSEHLAGESAAFLHAENKHRDRYRRWKDAQDRYDRRQADARNDRQIEAMLEVARGSSTRGKKATDAEG